MQFGWRLFMHSVRQLLLNLGAAVQISWLPFVLVVVAAAWIMQGIPLELSADSFEQLPPSLVSGFLFMVALAVFCFIWVAVNWHRYVLLAEYPSWLGSPPKMERMMAYLSLSLVIAFAAICMALVGFIVLGLLHPLTVIPGVGILILIGVQAVFGAVIFRISIALPSAAIGENLSLRQAVEASRGQMGPLIVLSLLITLLGSIPQFLFSTPLGPFVTSLPYLVSAQWLITMLSISVLTTLYGVFIEKRQLVV